MLFIYLFQRYYVTTTKTNTQCYNSVDYFRAWREMRAITEGYGEKLLTPEQRNTIVVYPKDPREGIAHCTLLNVKIAHIGQHVFCNNWKHNSFFLYFCLF